MIKLKLQLTNRNEKGIALLFTLIMLSLLLILALSFALDSMFVHKAAYNSANSSFSETMGQVQLQEVLSLVRNA
jgi:Tfp pilus assembly protein PilX